MRLEENWSGAIEGTIPSRGSADLTVTGLWVGWGQLAGGGIKPGVGTGKRGGPMRLNVTNTSVSEFTQNRVALRGWVFVTTGDDDAPDPEPIPCPKPKPFPYPPLPPGPIGPCSTAPTSPLFGSS